MNPNENKKNTQSGLSLITQERQRQIKDKGWTLEHDRHHKDGELAKVGAYYAWPGKWVKINQSEDRSDEILLPDSWSLRWVNKDNENKIKNLVKAGALIAAEIDRLLAEQEAKA